LKTRSTYWQLIPFIIPQWKTITKALVCTIGFTIFWPLLAWLAGEMAKYIGQGNLNQIAHLAGFGAVMFSFGAQCNMAKILLWPKVL